MASLLAVNPSQLSVEGNPDLFGKGNLLVTTDQLFKVLGRLMTESHGKGSLHGNGVSGEMPDEKGLLELLENLVNQGEPQAASLLKQMEGLGISVSELKKLTTDESEKSETGSASMQDAGGLLAALVSTLNHLQQKTQLPASVTAEAGSEIAVQIAAPAHSGGQSTEAGDKQEGKGESRFPAPESASMAMLVDSMAEAADRNSQQISKIGQSPVHAAQDRIDASLKMAQKVSGQGLAREPVVDVSESSGSSKSGPMALTDTMEVLISDASQLQDQQSSMDRHAGSELLRREVFHPGLLHVASQDESLLQVATGQPMATEDGGNVSSEQILDQVRSRLAEHRIDPDNGQVTLRLHPQELGELKISVRMDDQRLRVEIVAENRTVKDALMQNMDSLKDALARLNLEVERFNVTTGSRQFFNQGFSEGRQNNDQQAVPRLASWLTGRSAEQSQSAENSSWQPRENALLDMVM
jgi:flagellar hook-length control protein FliK